MKNNNELESEVCEDMYRTSNQTYGMQYNTKNKRNRFNQYEELIERRHAHPSDFPKDNSALSLTHNPHHPFDIQSMSNVPTNTRGQFTNVRQDFYTNFHGIWSNACFNTPGATIDRGIGTYSNLQGGWGRIGPSTYDSVHGNGPWVNQWGTRSVEPATLRSLRDHRNVDPRDNWIPIDNTPQNQPHAPRP